MKKSTAILKKTPASALAGPALNASFAHDREGLDRIIQCVPRKNVICPDPSYTFAREYLEQNLLLLGLSFWRAHAFAANLNGQILSDSARPADELIALDLEYQQWRSWARVLNNLLSRQCEAGGLSEPEVRDFLSMPEADDAALNAEELCLLDERLEAFKAGLAEAGRGI